MIDRVLSQFKSKSDLAIPLGLLLDLGLGAVPFVAPHFGHPLSPSAQYVLILFRYAGKIIFIFGCSMLAMAKGRTPAFGLFGIFSIVGLIPLVILVDRSEGPQAPRGFDPLPPKE